MAIQQNRQIQTTKKNRDRVIIEPLPKPLVPTYRTNQPTHIRQRDFINLFVANFGLIAKTCQQLHMDFKTYQRWMKEPKFQERFDIAQQKVNEIMEESLIQKALSTNSPVPEIFYLKSRDPRYSQRVTLEGEDDKPIQVTYNTETLKVISKAITGMLSK